MRLTVLAATLLYFLCASCGRPPGVEPQLEDLEAMKTFVPLELQSTNFDLSPKLRVREIKLLQDLLGKPDLILPTLNAEYQIWRIQSAHKRRSNALPLPVELRSDDLRVWIWHPALRAHRMEWAEWKVMVHWQPPSAAFPPSLAVMVQGDHVFSAFGYRTLSSIARWYDLDYSKMTEHIASSSPVRSVSERLNEIKVPRFAKSMSLAEAKRGQQKAAKRLGIPIERQLDLGGGVTMKLILIPEGEFTMGSRDTTHEVARKGSSVAEYFKDEHPYHHVHITKPFYMGVHEVTVAQFKQFVLETQYRTEAEIGDGGYAWNKKEGKVHQEKDANWGKPYMAQSDNHPVVLVTWNDCQRFTRWASNKSGKKVRLPTEAEWEYACRAGTITPFNTGETISTVQANFDGKLLYGDGRKGVFRQESTPVGRFKANSWGLHDMHGNVWEWCQDFYYDYYYNLSTISDPKGPTDGIAGPTGAMLRVIRGGSWNNLVSTCRSATRSGSPADQRVNSLGFRVVVSVSQEPR